MRKFLQKNEEGQSILEFSMTLIILIILVCVPIELIRYINLRTFLCSMATESITQVKYASVENNSLTQDIHSIIQQTYGDRLDVGTININADYLGKVKENCRPMGGSHMFLPFAVSAGTGFFYLMRVRLFFILLQCEC